MVEKGNYLELVVARKYECDYPNLILVCSWNQFLCCCDKRAFAVCDLVASQDQSDGSTIGV